MKMGSAGRRRMLELGTHSIMARLGPRACLAGGLFAPLVVQGFARRQCSVQCKVVRAAGLRWTGGLPRSSGAATRSLPKRAAIYRGRKSRQFFRE